MEIMFNVPNYQYRLVIHFVKNHPIHLLSHESWCDITMISHNTCQSTSMWCNNWTFPVCLELSLVVLKYWLPAVRIQNPAGLRRWNYLPHPYSLPLPSLDLVGRKWGCEGRGSAFIFWVGWLPPPYRAAGACRSAGGRQAPARGLRAKKNIYLHVGPCRLPARRQAPRRAVGVQNCKMWNQKYISVKNIFKNIRIKKPAKPCRILDPNRR